MNLLYITILTAVFAAVFAIRNHYQFLELNQDPKIRKWANKKWHRWQAFLQIIVLAMIVDLMLGHELLFGTTWQHWVLLALSCIVFWILFDGLLQVFRGKNFFEIGGGGIDRIFEEAFAKPSLVMHVVKFGLLAVLTTLYFTL